MVGAPGSHLTGFYKETPIAYPYYDTSGVSTTMGLQFPFDPRFDAQLQNLPAYTPQASGANAFWFFGIPNINFNFLTLYLILCVFSRRACIRSRYQTF